ncbi:MAG: cytochrome b562 [Planctomycetota bacterium]
MKRNLTTSLVALALGGALAFAFWPGTSTPALANQDSASDQAKLAEAMAVINTNFRSARRGARDASKNAETADALSEVIVASIACKDLMPRLVAETQGADQAELMKTYRRIMNDLIIVLAQAENAALAGDNEKLGELLREANEVKAEGHELFIPED